MHTEFIANSDILTNEYGGWPSFHDAEILGVTLSHADYHGMSKRARATIDVNVYVVKQINEGTVDFEIIKDKENVVTFEFNNIENLKLTDFHYQNIIDDIEFCKNAFSGMSVTFVSNIGAHISFECS